MYNNLRCIFQIIFLQGDEIEHFVKVLESDVERKALCTLSPINIIPEVHITNIK